MTTNQTFLSSVLGCEAFVKGEATTGLIAEFFPDDVRSEMAELSSLQWILAAAISRLTKSSQNESRLPFGFRNSIGFPNQSRLSVGQTDVEVELELETIGDEVRVKGQVHDDAVELTILAWDGLHCTYSSAGVQRSIGYLATESGVYLQGGPGSVLIEDTTLRAPQLADGVGSGKLKAPMDGAVVTITVKKGDQVSRGQTVAVIEAMKMEHPLKADVDGLVQAVHAELGAQVKGRQLLVEIEV
jgi:geranyl-CoA carboxylase alpha subunit